MNTLQSTLLRFALLMSIAVGESARAESPDLNWPQFRGVQACGVAQGFSTPEKGESFKWKTPVPGLGLSSPVIWSNKVFVTTAVTAKGEQQLKIGLYGDIESADEQAPHSWEVWCVDKNNGAVLWKKVAHEGLPRMKRHPKSSQANCTPATDGTNLVCFFGAEGLFCYSLEGQLRWRKDFGPLDSGYFAVQDAQWGFASSPVIHGGMVIVQCDVQTNSFLAALDIRDGKELWRTPRQDNPTWSTPTIDVRPGRAQILINGFRHMGGYDLRTGKELWKLSGAGDIPVPTPVVWGDLIFLTSAHGKLSPIYAIRANAEGDITLETNETTNRFIAWSLRRGGNYMQTPIVVGDHLFACKDNGVVSCYTAKTGEKHFEERLSSGRGGFTASPVADADKIHYTSEEGKVYTVRAAPKFELIATSDLGEPCMATPAISGGELFFRARHHILCVSRKPEQRYRP
ncbi:MAG TPA: PQQ-binding-like beta-propeller repeat protein [Verrucomicrobiae bacterium]|nr:PQQ-binding-like beta-propeller repeat protein [Verrucomicrobiae bacterium]